MKEKANEPKEVKRMKTISLRELDIKVLKKFDGISVDNDVKMTVYGTVVEIGRGEWDDKKTFHCTLEFKNVDVEKVSKKETAIEKMKNAENEEELEKAKKEADDGEES